MIADLSPNPTFDDFIDDTPAALPPTILDRSTLERWGTCPHQAAHIDAGRVTNRSADMDAGNEVHRILADAVEARVQHGVRPSALREQIELAAFAARPDVQPAVVSALRQRFAWVAMLTEHETGERAPEDILRYDGGAGKYAGQLAADIIPETDSTPAVRLTGELDLLMTTASPESLAVYDYKSGWKHWTATDVATSFQFQFYAWLVFRNYPGCNTVRVVVWNVREGRGTDPVEFRRRDFYAIEGRLRSAVDLHQQYHARDAEQIPAWPHPDKCTLCPAVSLCIHGHKPERDVAENPQAALRQLIVLEQHAANIRAQLTQIVRAAGVPVVADGIEFGTNKPKQARAVPCDYYSIKEHDGESEQGHADRESDPRPTVEVPAKQHRRRGVRAGGQPQVADAAGGGSGGGDVR